MRRVRYHINRKKIFWQYDHSYYVKILDRDKNNHFEMRLRSPYNASFYFVPNPRNIRFSNTEMDWVACEEYESFAFHGGKWDFLVEYNETFKNLENTVYGVSASRAQS